MNYYSFSDILIGMSDKNVTETIITFDDVSYKVSGKLSGTVQGFPNDTIDDKRPRYKFTVTITNMDSKRSRSFSFYTSINDFEKRKNYLDEDDVVFAFYCFISDSISGTYTFKQFCDEFGYDYYADEGWGYNRVNDKSKKIHDACVKSFKKAQDLGFTENELYNMVNYLQETYEV